MPDTPLQPFTEPLDEPVHHVPRRKKRRGRAVVGQLNLTSMIDVIFLLLIFFVVTANFRIEEGVLTATLPRGLGQPPPAATLPPQKVTITLTSGSDDTLVVIRRGATRYPGFGELREDLDQLRYDPDAGRHNGLFKPDNPIIIEPAGGVRWQHVVDAFNACLAAKYTNVSFAKPKG